MYQINTNIIKLVGIFHNHNLCNPDSDLDSLDSLDLWNAIFSGLESKMKKNTTKIS